MFIKDAWYIAAWAHEVKDQVLARKICNESIVIFRDKATQKAGALRDRCCHRGTPLSYGQVVQAGLECGYHGLIFNTAGACVHIPGQAKIPSKACVQSFPLVEKDECLWIWMGDPEKADVSKIVDYPYHNDHAKWPHKHEVYHVKANSMLMVDNLMDLTHLAYVHKSTIGGSNANAHIEAQMKVTPKDTGLHFIRWLLNSTPPPTYKKAVPDIGERVDRWMEFEFVAPGSVIQWTGGLKTGMDAQNNRDQEGGFSLRIFHGLTPETESSCFYFWSAANGYRQNDPQATEDLFHEITVAFSEDKGIVQAQQRMLDETGTSDLVDIVSDQARVHMRRTVTRLLAQEQQSAA
ncbi:aromatic ring-hydroxylating dioxygenase subunit alpha [Ottowia thiooxydans]|uniref:aromatic ring-hydroxylating dioxygenase subunit alpha n=1 Tax=Ottowia thiooxydans TaxID=219182 RepID=UPI0003FA3514|nr:aromatic ring-hydroxylating dioxygenase subunit alpha [Ottowia thiooxydans]